MTSPATEVQRSFERWQDVARQLARTRHELEVMQVQTEQLQDAVTAAFERYHDLLHRQQMQVNEGVQP